MTPSQLKYEHERRFPGSIFFSPENMKFAGDTMRNFGVRKVRVEASYDGEVQVVDAWELYRKQPTPKGLSKSFFFDSATFERHFWIKVLTDK